MCLIGWIKMVATSSQPPVTGHRPPATGHPSPRWPMPDSFGFSITDAIRFLPEIILIVAGTLLMVLDPVLHKRGSDAFGHITLLALVVAAWGAVCAYQHAGPAFGGMLL